LLTIRGEKSEKKDLKFTQKKFFFSSLWQFGGKNRSRIGYLEEEVFWFPLTLYSQKNTHIPWANKGKRQKEKY
jgi:hypothetical protein